MAGHTLLFSTDLHGKTSGFRAVLSHAAEKGIDKVVFGGDINPTKAFLRFKDGVIVPNPDSLKSLSDETVRHWFRTMIEINDAAASEKGLEKALGVHDAHYEVRINRSFRVLAEHAEMVYARLMDHVSKDRFYIGRLSEANQAIALSQNNPSRHQVVLYPEGEEKEIIVTKILPLIRRKLGLSLKRGLGDEELLDVYLRAAGGFVSESHGTKISLWREILGRQLPHTIKKAWADETAKLKGMIIEWERQSSARFHGERGQFKWLENDLLPEIATFKKGGNGREVFIMPGNDDYTKTLDILERAEAKGILVQIHGKVVPLDDVFHLGGYSWISDLQPRMMDDWLKDEEGMKQDLELMFRGCDQARTILSIHVPPRDGLLDINFQGEHIGSSAVREYLSTSGHPLALTGHVHEVVSRTKNWKERIGKTLVMTPGADHRDGVDALDVDLERPKDTKRIKIA